MTDSISDILAAKDGKPDEIDIIKQFVHEKIGMTPGVSVTKTAFIVTIPSASAVATLRFEIFRLERQLDSPRKIILKIV